ncbi:AAA family ATPase [Marinobacter hydrocarbonoclasticus]|nr:AAA family ATPase [Marinobacter nauticus]
MTRSQSPLSEQQAFPESMAQIEAVDRLSRRRTLPVMLSTLLVTPPGDDGHDLSEALLSVPNVKLTQIDHREVDGEHSKDSHLMVLLLPDDGESALAAIAHYCGRCKHTLVVGRQMHPQLLRAAMKAGAHDFLPASASQEELTRVLFDIAEKVATCTQLAPTIAVLNSKGGCGTSFISAAIADYLAARDSEAEIALLDGDQVQAGQSHLLDLEPEYYLHHALSLAEEMDDNALTGMMCQLENLHLLPASPFSQQSDGSMEYLQLPNLMFKIRCHYDAVVVDLSRGAEPWANPILMDADMVLVVIQDSLASLRSAAAAVRHLVFELGVSKNRIRLVFNRYQARKGVVSLSDVKEASGLSTVYTVRNDFKCVNTCLDEGKRLSRFAAKEAVSRDIAQICNDLLPPHSDPKGSGFWARLWR